MADSTAEAPCTLPAMTAKLVRSAREPLEGLAGPPVGSEPPNGGTAEGAGGGIAVLYLPAQGESTVLAHAVAAGGKVAGQGVHEADLALLLIRDQGPVLGGSGGLASWHHAVQGALQQGLGLPAPGRDGLQLANQQPPQLVGCQVGQRVGGPCTLCEAYTMSVSGVGFDERCCICNACVQLWPRL